MTRLGAEAAVAALEARPRLGLTAGTERTAALLAALGKPQVGLRGVLVGGTNGKGSVCALVEAICRAHGLSTLLLAKPHLVEWRERIAPGGVPVTPERFAELASLALAAAERMDQTFGPASRIELLTGMGLMQAALDRVDTVVCEVGVGGRLDSTNVTDLGVAVITNIGTDHRALLGHSPEAIATEKAAIIRSGADVVTAAQGVALTVIVERARGVGAASLVHVPTDQWAIGAASSAQPGPTAQTVELGGVVALPDIRLPLPGMHQRTNLALAAAASARVLGRAGRVLEPARLRSGVAAVVWPGRLQTLAGDPPLLLDAAHNPEALAALADAIGERRLPVVFGVLADKELELMLPSLRRLTDAPVMTTVASARAVAAADLADSFGVGAIAVAEVERAIAVAAARQPDQPVLVCGSVALVGDVLRRRS